MSVKHQLRFMTGLIYLTLANSETNKSLVILFCVLGVVEIFASYWYHFKLKRALRNE